MRLVGRERERNGRGHVELGVAHHAGEYQGDDHVENGADDQAREDSDGHVALRVLGLARRGRDGIETDVGEENDAGGGEYAADAVNTRLPGVRRNERVPVVRLDVADTKEDEY